MARRTRNQLAQEPPRVDVGRVDEEFIRNVDDALKSPKSVEQVNMPHAPPSDTQRPGVVQGGTIIAKEGKQCLVHSEDKIEAIYLDPTKTYSEKIEHRCRHRLAPTCHATRLDELVDAAAEDKALFKRGLKNVLKSYPFGNQRHIWRLEFEGEDSLNCGQMKHDEICARLSIISFLDLECTVSSSSNQTGDAVVPKIVKEMQSTVKSTKVDSPSLSVTKLEHGTELRCRSMQDIDKVRIDEEAVKTARHEHLLDAYDGDADVPPSSQLRMLSELEESSVYVSNPGILGLKVVSLGLKLDVSLLKRHMEAMHSDRRDICKPSRHADLCPCADDLQDRCYTDQDTRLKVVLEGLKNIALVFAPAIGLIYSQGTSPLSL
jgi:hypothetical protein